MALISVSLTIRCSRRPSAAAELKRWALKNMHVSLLEFLKTGRFGAINLGAFRSEVEAALGTPSDWSAKRVFKNAEIWKYGDVEFHFSENKVWSIFSDHGQLIDGGDAIEIEPWVIRTGVAYEFVGEQLRHEGIEFTECQSPHDPDRRMLMTSAGVLLYFSQKNSQLDDEPSLESWSFSQTK